MGINYPRTNLIWKLERMVPKQRRHRSLQQPSPRSSGIRLSLRWSWLAYVRGGGGVMLFSTLPWDLNCLTWNIHLFPRLLTLAKDGTRTWPDTAQTPVGTWGSLSWTSAPVAFRGIEMFMSGDRKC